MHQKVQHLAVPGEVKPSHANQQQLQQPVLEQLQQQATMLSSLPVVNKLLSNKEALFRLAAQSPVMERMLNQNPFMKDMLQPEAVTQLLQAAQNPQALHHLLGKLQRPFTGNTRARLTCASYATPANQLNVY